MIRSFSDLNVRCEAECVARGDFLDLTPGKTYIITAIGEGWVIVSQDDSGAQGVQYDAECFAPIAY